MGCAGCAVCFTTSGMGTSALDAAAILGICGGATVFVAALGCVDVAVFVSVEAADLAAVCGTGAATLAWIVAAVLATGFGAVLEAAGMVVGAGFAWATTGASAGRLAIWSKYACIKAL